MLATLPNSEQDDAQHRGKKKHFNYFGLDRSTFFAISGGLVALSVLTALVALARRRRPSRRPHDSLILSQRGAQIAGHIEEDGKLPHKSSPTPLNWENPRALCKN